MKHILIIILLRVTCIPVMAQLSIVEIEQGYTIEGKSVYYSSAVLSSTRIALTSKDIKAQNKKERHYKHDRGILVSLADAKTFKDLGAGYGVDCNNVFYRGTILENADPASFVLLDHGYSKDNGNVFYKTVKIEGADLSSFKVGGDGDYSFAYDNSYLYFHRNKEEIDIETFEIDEHFRTFRDKNHTFRLKKTSSGGLIERDCYLGHEVDTYPVYMDTIPFRGELMISLLPLPVGKSHQ